MAEETAARTAPEATGGDGGSRVDRLAEDVARLREDLRRLAEHLGEEGMARAGRVREVAEEKLRELERALAELRREAEAARRRATAGLEETVREQPLVSLLAAFGVGVLIGRLLGR